MTRGVSKVTTGMELQGIGRPFISSINVNDQGVREHTKGPEVYRERESLSGGFWWIVTEEVTRGRRNGTR